MESPLEILSRAAGLVSNSKKLLEEEDQPLDFSLGGSSRHSDTPTTRPTVIHHPAPPTTSTSTPSITTTTKKKTRPTKPRPRHSSTSSNSSNSNSSPMNQKFLKRKRKRGEKVDHKRRIVVITSKEDDIEEHFRRSLGEDYMNRVDQVEKKEDHISVDDHFAKALGTETWKKLKH